MIDFNTLRCSEFSVAKCYIKKTNTILLLLLLHRKLIETEMCYSKVLVIMHRKCS